MIRVLQLTSTSDIGGAETMVFNLCNGLDRTQFEPVVGSLVGSGALTRRCEEAGIQAVDFRFRSAADLGGIARLVRFIRENRIDLVQTHGLRADGVARWAARAGGAKVVISTIHSVDPWRRWYHSALDRVTAPFVDRYVAVCEKAREIAIQREKLPAKAVSVIPIGVPVKEVPRERRDEIRQKLGVPVDAFPVVGLVANLRWNKGHRHLLHSAKELAERYPQLHLVFAGKDFTGGEVAAEVARLGLQGHVLETGYINDVWELFAALDLCALPSQWEGLPVSLIEAMHGGVPVIATAVGGIPELIRHGVDGILIDGSWSEKTTAELTAAIGEITENWALRAALAKAASARAQDEYNLAKMVGRYETLFNSTLQR